MLVYLVFIGLFAYSLARRQRGHADAEMWMARKIRQIVDSVAGYSGQFDQTHARCDDLA